MPPPNNFTISLEIIIRLLQRSNECNTLVGEAVGLLAETIANGGTIFVCGNGGNAAHAEHFAAELVGRLNVERAPISAIALTSSGPIMTCIANDYHYKAVFSRQILALARPGDVLVALSVSGKSPNILMAFEAARELSLKSIALTGDGSHVNALDVDIHVRVPSENVASVQIVILVILHAIAESLETYGDHHRRSRPACAEY
jgi:D-sedoheptulose 7-phosphate isomerase